MQIQLARKYSHAKKLKRKIDKLLELEKLDHEPSPPPLTAETLVSLVAQSGELSYVEIVNYNIKESPSKKRKCNYPISHTQYPDRHLLEANSRAYAEEVLNCEVGLVPCEPDQTRLENDWRYQLHQQVEALKITHRLFESQSGELGDGAVATQASDSSTEQVLAFHEENAGYKMTKIATYENTMDHGYNVDADLGAALQRPVKIFEALWAVDTTLIQKFNPWQLLHDNPFFNDKIKNYELLRHKLNVRIVISGTPFHYGRAILAYNPYSAFDDITPTRNPLSQDVIGLSQKPHVWVDPASNQGGTLELPFFWTGNFLSLTQGDVAEMGDLYLQSTQTLRHANGGDDPVSISIFAWASDVKLAVPTSVPEVIPFESQSGLMTMASNDEYGMGIISKPASAVAQAAGALTKIPLFRPYARATEIVASATSKVAMLFGFSRPAVISNIQLFKPFPQGNLANVDAPDAVQKLSLDSKQEITVDPTTVGLAPEDEMTILGFVKRESYLTSFEMKAGEGVDTNLWECRVRPGLYDIVQTTFTEYHGTPMAHMATAFDYWHGSITYKFQIVKSKFHKGKILVEYDPSFFNSQNASFNTNYTRIIDLADNDDFELTVGWCQAEAFKRSTTYQSTTLPHSTTGSFAPNFANDNGMIRVKVLNNLVSPSGDTDISFNVFVHMNDDAKFGKPSSNNCTNFSYFTPAPGLALEAQSGEANLATLASIAPAGAPSMEDINDTSPATDNYMSVFFGEHPTSIRELIKRYVFMRAHSTGPPDQNLITDIDYTVAIRPLYRGFDSFGIDTTALTTPYTYYNNTYFTHFAPCFAGYRGSFRKKFVFSGNTTTVPYNPVVARFSNLGFPYAVTKSLRAVETQPQVDSVANTVIGQASPMAAAATTNLGVNNTIEVEFPYYDGNRFAPARQVTSQNLNRARYRMKMGIEPANTADAREPLVATEFSACGDDMSFFFFTGVPITYNVPTPAFN